jgi:hypothetical protein
MMTRAVDEARRIFAAAGIDLVMSTDSPDVWVRVCLSFPFTGTNTQKPRDVLGAAPFDKDGPGRIAYVFWRPVFDLAAEKHANEGVVLGHVMAHELGHLLLGGEPGSAHSAGIMKHAWDKEHVEKAKSGRLFFTPDQALRMQGTLRRR